MQSVLRFESQSEEETRALGRHLACQLPENGVVLLIGELGAGKTTLAKGIVEGRGAARPEDVSSPTFTLIHEYGDPVSVYHIDLYRLDTPQEARRLGLEDIYDARALVLIEWGERFPELLPAERVEVSIREAGDGARIIEVTAKSRRASPDKHPSNGIDGRLSSKRMDTLKAELAEFQSAKDLKTILAVEGPCLSVYIPFSTAPPNQSAKANALEWKEVLRSIEPKIQQNRAARELLESIRDWDEIFQGQEPQGRSIAVLRSPDVFRITWIEEPVKSRAELGPHFYIRPLLPELTRDKAFYILALSQKNVRLLRCTARAAEEVPFPPHIATSYDAYMNTAKPDHVSDNRASPGPGAGSSKGVMFTTSSDREDKDEYLTHFFRHIDRAVEEILRGKSEPVVLAGVEYELALYRSFNSNLHLAPESVQGAPNSLKSGEMHARALDAMLRCYEKKIDEALAQYNHRVGAGASNRLKDVVTAAHDGRVLTLLVSDSLESTGVFDETTHTVKGRQTGSPEDEDLINDAAVQTILHAGQVFVVSHGKMPNGAPLAAIFRF